MNSDDHSIITPPTVLILPRFTPYDRHPVARSGTTRELRTVPLHTLPLPQKSTLTGTTPVVDNIMLPILKGSRQQGSSVLEEGGKRRRVLPGKLRSEEWCGSDSVEGIGPEENDEDEDDSDDDEHPAPGESSSSSSSSGGGGGASAVPGSKRGTMTTTTTTTTRTTTTTTRTSSRQGARRQSKKKRKKKRKGTYAMPFFVRPEPSKYVGVSWVRARNKWVAQIIVKGERIHIGYFNDEVEAALRYDETAALNGKPVNFPRAGRNERQAYKNGSKKAPPMPPSLRPRHRATVASAATVAQNVRSEIKSEDDDTFLLRGHLQQQQEQQQQQQHHRHLFGHHDHLQSLLSERGPSLDFPSTPEEDDPYNSAFSPLHSPDESYLAFEVTPAREVGGIEVLTPTNIPMVLSAPSTPSPMRPSSSVASSSMVASSLPPLLTSSVVAGTHLPIGAASDAVPSSSPELSSSSSSSPKESKKHTSELGEAKCRADDGDSECGENDSTDWQFDPSDDLFVNLNMFGNW